MIVRVKCKYLDIKKNRLKTIFYREKILNLMKTENLIKIGNLK